MYVFVSHIDFTRFPGRVPITKPSPSHQSSLLDMVSLLMQRRKLSAGGHMSLFCGTYLIFSSIAMVSWEAPSASNLAALCSGVSSS